MKTLERPDVKNITQEDIQALIPTIEKISYRMSQSISALREWEPEDLTQECFLKIYLKIDKFSGRSSLKTWASVVARNHIIELGKQAKRNLPTIGDIAGYNADPKTLHKQMFPKELRTSTYELLDWLKKNPEEVKEGWEILNLMLWSHADHSYVSFKMCVSTGYPWTRERVRNVIRKIRKTPNGSALCQAVGLTNRLPTKETLKNGS